MLPLDPAQNHRLPRHHEENTKTFEFASYMGVAKILTAQMAERMSGNNDMRGLFAVAGLPVEKKK